MNDPNEGIETLYKFYLFLPYPFFIEMNDPNEGIETTVTDGEWEGQILDRNEWPEWGDWDRDAVRITTAVGKTIEMNDPNEGIETQRRLAFRCQTSLIEMNDPNEGIETLLPAPAVFFDIYRNEWPEWGDWDYF